MSGEPYLYYRAALTLPTAFEVSVYHIVCICCFHDRPLLARFQYRPFCSGDERVILTGPAFLEGSDR